MADLGKFPGTEMEVFSKYPDSYRLDHPDYGDVAKTPYAKGVISDFKRPDVANPNDPFVVESMVKVTGDWGESDYIPLFYHPKKLYWDNPLAEPPVLAQDFDVATGAKGLQAENVVVTKSGRDIKEEVKKETIEE